jgi:NADH:ubiquinone oxidoreductase subunit 5 (subunit L)/multisubunit Na+/H+ antiporter MnhA subunit
MTNYLPLIFGISSLLLGIYLFLVFFGIYKPKTSDQTEEKSENMKIIMKVISIILILKGCYNLLNLDSHSYKTNSTN